MASFVALGVTQVPAPGTPVALTLPSGMAIKTVHAILIEALAANTGKVYIGLVGMNKTTLAGVITVLPVPTTNLLPTFSASIAQAANGLPASTLFVDADQATDGILASALVA